jgi:glutathione-regulated potassium-efflux system ancillary protein KefG
MVNTDELADAHELAQLLQLAHSNSVSTYQRRYLDMPRPVLDLGRGRPKLWLRSEITDWAETKHR